MKFAFAIAGAAIAAIVATSLPSLAAEVPCDGFVLGFDGPAKKKTCTVEDQSYADTEMEIKSIDVDDQTFSLWVTYYHAQGRTYIPSHPIEELLRDTTFTQVQPLGVSRKVRGFDAIAFDGVPRGQNYVVTCALFARYTGNPGNYEFDAGPGSKNLTMGMYCADPGFLTPAQQKDGFYDVVGQVMAKLRLPPEN